MRGRQFPCPKCGRVLKQSGEVICAGVGETVPVFQCDECLVQTDFLGEKVEIALTFALDKDGKPFDPASPDGSLPDF
jgi:hypothetical protein